MIWIKAFFLTGLVLVLIAAFTVLQIIMFPVLICVAVFFMIWFILKVIQEEDTDEPKT